MWEIRQQCRAPFKAADILMTTNKFATDTVWSYAAFAVMATGGLVINVVVGAAFGATGLGIFGQAMAVFVIAGHASAAGLHNATFRTIALTPDVPADILMSGLAAALPFALGTAVLTLVCAPAIGDLLNSPATAMAIIWMAPGLLFFGFNKIGLAALNGMALMQRHAVGQMLRYLVITATVAAVAATDDGPERLGAAFSAAEIAVSLYLVVATRPLRRRGDTGASWGRAYAMLQFGLRSFGASLMADINLRVDTLMLGLFLGDREVGIYAFAAMLVEGLGNVTLVLRNLVNPRLTRLLAAGDGAAIRRLVTRVQLVSWPVLIFAFILAWLFYQPAVRLVNGTGELEQGLAVLLILIAMMAPYLTYSTFEEVLMLSGHAGAQSLFQISVTFTNAMLNLALIPSLGIQGAAIATGLASLLACLLLVVMVRYRTGYLLLPAVPQLRLSTGSEDR
jgi:O-antigen/teichoic acid export membrane protein